MALHMQQLLKQAGHELPSTKPVLEVNPTHPILDLMDKEQDDERFADWSHLLLDQALAGRWGAAGRQRWFCQTHERHVYRAQGLTP